MSDRLLVLNPVAPHLITEVEHRRLLDKYNATTSVKKNQIVEVEFRFGEWQNGKVITGVSYLSYHNMRTQLMKMSGNAFNSNIYTEYIQQNDQDRTRYISLDKSGSMFIKNTKTSLLYEPNEYGIVRSIAEEYNSTVAELPKNISMIREKNRMRFPLLNGNLVIDLTEITVTDNLGTPSERKYKRYEAELELINPLKVSYAQLDKCLFLCFKSIHDTALIYSINLQTQVIDDFNRLLGSSRTNTIDGKKLAQARNISLNDLKTGLIIGHYRSEFSKLSPQLGPTQGPYYTVSVKTDGLRKFLYFHATGVYFIASPRQMNKIRDIRTMQADMRSLIGTVIEGEYIRREDIQGSVPELKPEHKGVFLAYDCIASGNNIKIQSFPYVDRLKKIDNVITSYGQNPDFLIQNKEVHFICDSRDFFRLNNKLINELYPYKTDGLIYTPNIAYNAEPSLKSGCNILKWKPADKLTMDFRLVFKDKLYLTCISNDGKEIPFVGNNIHPFSMSQFEIPANVETLYGLICETRFHQGKLEVERIRTDKQFPNNIDTILSIWRDIHQPLTKELMCGQEFGLVFKYHNEEKDRLYSFMASQLTSAGVQDKVLLCIGSGRGGDLSKWDKYGFHKVIAVEPNMDNLTELNHRLKSYPHIQCDVLNTVGQDVDAIIDKVKSSYGQVHAIVYMLSLTFFFDNSESTQSIADIFSDVLAPQGCWATLTMDGSKVIDYFNYPDNYTITKEPIDGKRSNLRQIDFVMALDQSAVYIHIPDSIVEKQYEYLTDLTYLDKLMNCNGLIQIMRRDINKGAFLNEEEIIFSNLYTGLVYQKTDIIQTLTITLDKPDYVKINKNKVDCILIHDIPQVAEGQHIRIEWRHNNEVQDWILRTVVRIMKADRADKSCVKAITDQDITTTILIG